MKNSKTKPNKKAGVIYVITSKKISLLTVSITIFIFILSFLFYNSYLKLSREKQNILYSNTIPIDIRLQPKKENLITEKPIKIASSNESNIKTKRQVLDENKQSDWRIKIPKINLNAHIQEGTSDAVLLQAVGHFEQTNNWEGNVGLASHNRGYQCSFFQKIKSLKIGDEIIYQTNSGKKVYQVQINKVIEETDWSYLEKTKDNRITLITCEENRKEYRRCIQAVEIASYEGEKI